VKILAVAACALFVSSVAVADDHEEWSYTGEHGPDHWSELKGAGLCSAGKNQSPVDIRDAVTAKLVPLSFKYDSFASEVFNNGHTLQVGYAPGSELVVAGHTYVLKQFHFHAPSENLLGGRQFPLEAHFVHADADGNLAVVAVFFDEGALNAGLEKFWKDLPSQAGDKRTIAAQVSATELMPTMRDYYRFSGSLTTPPCSEGVNWLVLKHPLTLSTKQLEQFKAALGHTNARPVQPLNARVIVQ
jgi:carbonic anhydrase